MLEVNNLQLCQSISKSNWFFDTSIASSWFFFPTKHHKQTGSELTSIWTSFLVCVCNFWITTCISQSLHFPHQMWRVWRHIRWEDYNTLCLVGCNYIWYLYLHRGKFWILVETPYSYAKFENWFNYNMRIRKFPSNVKTPLSFSFANTNPK